MRHSSNRAAHFLVGNLFVYDEIKFSMRVCEKISQISWILYLIAAFPASVISTALVCLFSCSLMHKLTRWDNVQPTFFSDSQWTFFNVVALGLVFLMPVAWTLSICIAQRFNNTRYEWIPFVFNTILFIGGYIVSTDSFHSRHPGDIEAGLDFTQPYLLSVILILIVGSACSIAQVMKRSQ